MWIGEKCFIYFLEYCDATTGFLSLETYDEKAILKSHFVADDVVGEMHCTGAGTGRIVFPEAVSKAVVAVATGLNVNGSGGGATERHALDFQGDGSDG